MADPRHSLQPADSEFILPVSNPADSVTFSSISPSKQLSSRLTGGFVPPESPDMKFARSRFGNLLTSIRKIDQAPAPIESSSLVPMDSPDRRKPGRPRKPLLMGSKSKSGEIIFELRGKPFALREDHTCTEYQLCRAWMRGKINKEETRTPQPEIDPNVSMDLLATREIYALPRANIPYTLQNPWPVKEDMDQFDKTVDPQDIDQLRREYARHWRHMKSQWNRHMRERAKRYQKTVGLLETIYLMTEQARS